MKKHFITSTSIIALFFYAGLFYSSSGGRNDARANAPSDNGYCINCHSNGTGGGSISISNLPNEWSPYTTYPITVTINDPDAAVGGFQVVATNGQDNSQQGIFTAPTGTRINTINRIVHDTPKSFLGNQVSWTFDWTAPGDFEPVEDIVFYFSGNAANGNGNTGGDYGYASSSVSIPRTCNPPIEFWVYNVTDTRATIEWIEEINANNYRIRYRPIGSSTWTGTNSGTRLKVRLKNLSPSTTYEYEIRSVCSNGLSPWSGTYLQYLDQFTTSSCTTPPYAGVSNITATSAVFNYTGNGDYSSYNVKYRVAGSSSAWQSVYTSNASYKNISGLMPSTMYEYKIRGNCDYGWTAHGTTSNFTTAAALVGNNNHSDASIQIATNAQLNVFPNPAATQFQINTPQTQGVRLYSLQGTLLKQWTLPADKQTFDITEIPAGLYLIEVETNNDLQVKELVKL